MFRKIKNLTISKSIQTVLNKILFKGYGEMVSFRLDSVNRSLSFEIMLKGEVETLKVEIGSYEIQMDGEKSYIKLSNITTSREWLTKIAENYLNGRRFELSSEIQKVLGILI